MKKSNKGICPECGSEMIYCSYCGQYFCIELECEYGDPIHELECQTGNKVSDNE